jgi:NAD(P)-dependent dehydrogenase (short-subunit alcohol dehydrogenase family)
MDLKLIDRMALVSASTAGIGLAIATTLAQEGATVIVNGRTPERVDAAISHIKQTVTNARLQGVVADLGTQAGASELCDRVPAVDILVNNLGIYGSQAFAEISDDEWLKFLEVNVISGVRLSRHYLPLMLNKNWGRIIFISSESGLNIPAEMIHYGVTKTAQLPGPTRSEGVEDFIQGLATDQSITPERAEQEFFEKMRPSSLLKRFATPAEVAALVAFVASPLSSATNGAALRVDGGVVRSIV